MINDLAKVVMWTNKNICIEGGERSGLIKEKGESTPKNH